MNKGKRLYNYFSSKQYNFNKLFTERHIGIATDLAIISDEEFDCVIKDQLREKIKSRITELENLPHTLCTFTVIEELEKLLE